MLKPRPPQDVPADTFRVAQAAFPQGNTYLTLRDELGTIFSDEDFANLYPQRGQPALPPWQLALLTLVQFRENLSDRQAAEAVRARIDIKYLLGLGLEDAGFHYSVLSEFRARLVSHGTEETLLDRLLIGCRERGFIKERGRARTDTTRVFAAVRVMNRLEVVGETLRATLNDLATVAPVWLQRVAPDAWYGRYTKRIEDNRLPATKAQRDTYACTVGEDGLVLLGLLRSPTAPEGLAALPSIQTLQRVWERHFVHEIAPEDASVLRVRLKSERELPPAAEAIESPYDVDARYRSRSGLEWTGYLVHLTEICEEDTLIS